ncbi:MAG: DNA-binding protein [Candidatus Buchananbacteria bacterium CG10_big_fil_rev_8_21_14_0_10_42_9]|uniref:DNA-binding protein n=1 Tax=Candidatus Buchananbacteria bacterium CG10_big_fil_rev_8_21_14_0_10_42_9 TaxID=1974526 RepID=A0A2H0W0R1_9BACT|nr:MAG: DNA-binding protein [Candidatus Buchananbacteria bacterium CG10_big_fil_rev_8_21_14_0_10_42_9]
MNKAQLADLIAEKAGISKKQAEVALDTLTHTITEKIKAGEEVTLTGFGAFSSKVRKGRIGVNPRNPQEEIEIKPTRVAKFKAGKNLKEALKSESSSPTQTPTSKPAESYNPAPNQSAPDAQGQSGPQILESSPPDNQTP